MSPWQLMLLPFLECLVLVGIHSYLGIHVIKRKVIFVDLALAQIAALGTIAAFMFDIPPQTTGAYVFSLLFTFIGAGVFSLTRLRKERIPQEAVIGIVYAFAAAVAILVIDRAPHGAEHIKEILTGSILWVRWQTVAIAAAIYAGVGVFHYAFRDRFLLISNDASAAYRKGLRVRLWDFFFYMSFGLVITISVNTAGVLLVFVFLVVPAILAISITDRLLFQLLIGWGVGTAVSFAGLVGSYLFDLPSGPMVVAVYGLALLLVALGLYIARSVRPARAALHVGAGAAAVAVMIAVFFGLGTWLRGASVGPEHHGRDHGNGAASGSGAGLPGAQAPARALLDRLAALDVVERPALLGGERDAAVVRHAFEQTNDEELKTALARRLLDLDPDVGRDLLLREMATGRLAIFRSEAFETLKGLAGNTFGYEPLDAPDSPANRAALEKWRAWLARHGS
ncbi:MAG: metal ABC transporter permease [Deltaproteobacteria bacterium]|nr:metal ABC transporter permease [Deltaproteobacteria bacterium]